jgi:hypothetical protein
MMAEFRIQPEQQLSEQGVQRCLSVVSWHRAYCTRACAPDEARRVVFGIVAGVW